ncbi:type II toxin-antitoxin system YafQ family toxin [Lactobacillus sp. B4005]|uniref:type II toxin-antitoxin system YafQ family toxin n=1 Tax=Lactobacillus sp. B4005 TaxID=2818031 RepID=UPI0022698252|nr:type II toxin-antitoxin system YafQ family toxin [Lactobacillus sp. B4005]MCX8723889.1 type II toxin-antitoxin system YafQ family toxin [Lactobacillus sp. B4005]
MMKAIKYTKVFKKQLKKRRQDSKWHSVFNGTLPYELDKQERSPWEFIIRCLIEDHKIPDYFHPHALEGLNNIKKKIKKQLNDAQATIIVLELHFDGHSGDHLLVYVPTQKTVFLAGIGTHSELFK